jgi:hypothetical protein
MRAILSALAACLLLVSAVALGQTNTTTTSVSSAEVDTINTTNVTQRVDTFSTELRARVGNGSFLYDQTFNVAFSDPTVQNAINAARNVLTAAGAVTITGPTQISSNTSQVNSQTNTVQTNKQTTGTIVITGDFVGPTTVTTGNLGVCQSYTPSQAGAGSGLVTAGYPLLNGCSLPGTPLVVVPGGIDFDTRTVTLVTISQTATTTNTFLTTAVYELDGFLPGTQPPATPVPPSLVLVLTGLAGAGLYEVRRRLNY